MYDLIIRGALVVDRYQTLNIAENSFSSGIPRLVTAICLVLNRTKLS